MGRSGGCAHFQHIVQLGMGKSGTTAVGHFFEDLGYRPCSNMTWRTLRRAADAGRPLFEEEAVSCSLHVEIATFMDGKENFVPQLTHATQMLTEMVPRHTLFVLVERAAASWTASVRAWNNLATRIATRQTPGYPPGARPTDHELAEWYRGFNTAVHFFFHGRPNYVHVNMSEPNTTEALLRRTCKLNETHRGASLKRANVNGRSKAADK